MCDVGNTGVTMCSHVGIGTGKPNKQQLAPRLQHVNEWCFEKWYAFHAGAWNENVFYMNKIENE